MLAACQAPTPQQPLAGHLSTETTQPATRGEIPAPVQQTLALPKPRAVPKAETYSVVVNNVQVADLLFALARDAKVNVDIHPGITGTVSLNAISEHDGPLGSLFKGELERRIAWARRPERSQQELALAASYLERRDYLRTAIFLLEGLVTQEVFRRKGNDGDYTERNEARKALADGNRSFKTLDLLRNSLAHGSRSDNREVAALLTNEKSLQETLARFARELPQ